MGKGRKKKKQQGNVGLALIVLVLGCALTLAQRFMSTPSDAESRGETSVEQSAQTTASSQPSFKLELPQNVTERTEQVIEHLGYTTSYNNTWLIPNWVAYDLTAAEVKGDVPRQQGFTPDPQVKGATAVHDDYTRSGYSRGHMAPAADMRWSKQAMEESFYLSNVCPQKAELNAGSWEKVERMARRLAGESVVYICCGPLVDENPERIGRHGVAVPSRFFKVMCMQRKNKWQAIGFVMPNEKCSGSLFDYAVSVDDVEKLTGLDFFYQLPDDVENTIEAAWSQKDWQ